MSVHESEVLAHDIGLLHLSSASLAESNMQLDVIIGGKM